MGFIRVLEERRKMFFFFNIQAQCAIPKWIQYFHGVILLYRLNKI